MATVSHVLRVNGLSLLEDSGITYDGLITNLSADPNWSATTRENALGDLRWTRGAFQPRKLVVRFSKGTTADLATLLAAINPKIGPWTLRAFIMVGIAGGDTATAEVQVATTNIHIWQGTVLAELTQLSPIWRKITQDTVGAVTCVTNATTAAPFTVAGQAPTSPIVTTVGTGSNPAGSLNKRKRFTITNTGDTPLNRRPWRVSLGDTSAWPLTGSGYTPQIYCFLNGKQVPRTIINGYGQTDDIQTYMWIPLTIAPGQTLEYEVVYGGEISGVAPLGLVQADFLAIDTAWFTGLALTGSTSSLIKATGLTANAWQWGRLRFMSGARAGEEAEISSNTGTDINLATALTGAPAINDKYLVYRSSNAEWVYDVRRIERSNDNRGLWYQNRGQSRPSDIRFDTPGCWAPLRSLYNDDDVSQPRTLSVALAPTPDFFSLPSIRRTWHNGSGGAHFLEKGQADAVGFSSELPITYWRLDFLFTNPNGVGKAFLGTRESTAEDWEEVVSSIAASTTPTTTGPTKYLVSGDQRHLLFALWPRDEDEMPTSWARDTGSWTAGGSSTLFDDSKAWEDDQWAGATIKITEGKGRAQQRVVTGGDANHVTISVAWDVTPDSTSRYEITQQPLIAQLDSGDTWVVGFTTTAITVSALGAEETVSPIELIARLDGGATGTTLPHYRLRVGMDLRRLFLASTESLVIDGEARRATVIVTSGGALVKDVTAWVEEEQVRSDRTLDSTVWIEAQPGSHNVYIVNQPRGGGVTAAIATRPGWYS